MVRRYLRAELWTYVRRHPGSRVVEIAQALKLKRRALSTTLCAMRRDGILRNEGRTHQSRWFISGPKPTCAWGLHVNSVAQLQKTPLERAALLRKAYIAKGLDPDNIKPRKRRKARQYYTGELEACWRISQAPQGD